MLRQHHSQTEKVVSTNPNPSITEQAHAQDLEIAAMVRSGGFSFSDRQGTYQDISDLPPLDALLNNRLRLIQVHSELSTRIKRNLPTVDSFIRAITEGSDEELMDIGLMERPKPKPPEEPAPAPSPAPQTGET